MTVHVRSAKSDMSSADSDAHHASLRLTQGGTLSSRLSCVCRLSSQAERSKTNSGMPEVLVFTKLDRLVCFCNSQLDERQ